MNLNKFLIITYAIPMICIVNHYSISQGNVKNKCWYLNYKNKKPNKN